MPTEYCTYCGLARGDRLSCCGENHFQTAQEFKDYHGEWPEDVDEEESSSSDPRAVYGAGGDPIDDDRADDYCTMYHCPGDCGLKGHK